MPSSNGTKKLTSAFLVRINGSDLPFEAISDLLSVTVYEDIQAPGMFTLLLINWDMNRLKITWADDDLFAEGNAAEIHMGYLGDLKVLMVGEITGLEPSFNVDDTPTLTVRGHDRRHHLLRGHKTRSFVAVKDSDIASQIAGDLGLTAQVEDTGVNIDSVMQRNQTDMEFLQERARRIGYEIVVEDKTLYFRPHQNASSEVVTLTREEDLIEFYPRMTTLNQVGEVIVKGWSPKDKAAIVGKVAAGDESTKMGGSTTGTQATVSAFGSASLTSVNWPVFSRAEAEQIALGQLDDLSLAFISGEGISNGRTDLRAGTVVKIEGVGKRFSGNYYVTTTTHSWSPANGYRTAFTVKRNAQ